MRTRQPPPIKTSLARSPSIAQGDPKSLGREATNAPLTGRFAAGRVRHAGSSIEKVRLRPQQGLLIAWQAGEPEPMKYWLSTLPEDIPLNDRVASAHHRWRIERDPAP